MNKNKGKAFITQVKRRIGIILLFRRAVIYIQVKPLCNLSKYDLFVSAQCAAPRGERGREGRTKEGRQLILGPTLERKRSGTDGPRSPRATTTSHNPATCRPQFQWVKVVKQFISFAIQGLPLCQSVLHFSHWSESVGRNDEDDRVIYPVGASLGSIGHLARERLQSVRPSARLGARIRGRGKRRLLRSGSSTYRWALTQSRVFRRPGRTSSGTCVRRPSGPPRATTPPRPFVHLRSEKKGPSQSILNTDESGWI